MHCAHALSDLKSTNEVPRQDAEKVGDLGVTNVATIGKMLMAVDQTVGGLLWSNGMQSAQYAWRVEGKADTIFTQQRLLNHTGEKHSGRHIYTPIYMYI